MHKGFGWVGKILWVNLSERTTHTLSTLDYGAQYIGGRGIIARIAWDSIPQGIGAFDPDNLLMIFTGPLTGTTAPFSGRTTIGGLAPQGWPHEWCSRSSLGGHWGPTLKYAGYDGLVIAGVANRPTTLWIEDEHVQLLDASHLWGRGTIETQQILMGELGTDVRILTIGQAGERLSRIATICTETGSAAGQGGYGAVMGSKCLKAIAVRGTGPIYTAKPDLFVARCKAIIRDARAGRQALEPRLPPPMVDKFGLRWQACTQQCAVRCAHFYSQVEGPATGQCMAGQFHCVSAFFPGISGVFYDWKLGFEGGFEARHLADDWGLNHWDLLLGIVPWLRLCQQAGLVSEIGGVPIDFDDAHFWSHLLHAIAFREGTGDALAEGGCRAPALLGFGEKLVSPLYAGWGYAGHWDGHGDRGNRIVYPFWLVPALQWAVDVRDPFSSSHGYVGLTMSGFGDQGFSWDVVSSVGCSVYGSSKPVDPLSNYEDKELAAVWHGHRSVLKDSLTVDDQVFPRFTSYTSADGLARADDMEGPDFEYHLYTAATGEKVSRQDLDLACERIFNLERAIQIRNYDRHRHHDLTVIPYFEQPEWWQNPLIGENRSLERDRFIQLLDKYYRLRGWDLERARPTWQKLRELGLFDVAEELNRLGQIVEIGSESVATLRSPLQ